MTRVARKQTGGGATAGCESGLRAMADALRGSMDAAGYKHVVPGLILFRPTRVPACLRFLARRRGRRGESLFTDARKPGRMVDRTHRGRTGGETTWIADTCRARRTGGDGNGCADGPGFCRGASPEEVRSHGHLMTPGRHVGVEPREDDGEPFGDEMKRPVTELRGQQAEGARRDAATGGSYDLLVSQPKTAKLKRQVIVVAHNPNTVVHGGAEFVLSLDSGECRSRAACKGGLRENRLRDEIRKVVEGGREALANRYRHIMTVDNPTT